MARKARGFYIPYGHGIDSEDLEQEAALAELPVASKPAGYRNRTVRNALGMIIERERAKKRYPEGGVIPFHKFSDFRYFYDPKDEATDVEGEVFVNEVIESLSSEAREVIKLRLDPRAMSDYYERVDKPIPTVPSYLDLSRHLGVSVAAIIRSIEEARRIVESE